jgi:glycine/D-amino acid oxidase-like deaminating enzyme
MYVLRQSSSLLCLISLACCAVGMRVAIVGGGFSGLATALKLAKGAKLVHIFDPLAVGSAAASSIAGGLIHPHTPRGNLIWNGLQGFYSSKSLLDTLESGGYKNIIREDIKLMRPAFTQDDLDSWNKASDSWPELVDCIDTQNIRLMGLSEHAVGCFLIKTALVLHPVRYLQALWKAVAADCDASAWFHSSITDISQLSASYDVVVLANGHSMPQLWSSPPIDGNGKPSPKLKVNYVQGRIFQYDNENIKLDYAILGGEYIVPTDDVLRSNPRSLLSCGSTHEHLQESDVWNESSRFIFQQQTPVSDSVEGKLQSKLHHLYPTLQDSQPLSIASAIRLVTERSHLGRLPIVGKHRSYDNVWTIAGMGSRGLVYHALCADYLVKAIAQGSEEAIPLCLRPQAHAK